MALKQLRRFIFAFAAVALLFATVLPSVNVNADGTGSQYMGTMAAMEDVSCPKCDKTGNEMVNCVQAMCLGAAVITDSKYFDVLAMPPIYRIVAETWPADVKSALITPPI